MINKDNKYICFRPTLSIFICFGFHLFFSNNFELLYFNDNWISRTFKLKNLKKIPFSFKKITERFDLDNQVKEVIKNNLDSIDDLFVSRLIKINIGINREIYRNVVCKLISEELAHYYYFLNISKRNNVSHEKMIFDYRLKKIDRLLHLMSHKKIKLSLSIFIETLISKLILIFLLLNLIKNFLFNSKVLTQSKYKYIIRAYNAGFNLETHPKLDWMVDSVNIKNNEVLILKEDKLSSRFDSTLSKKYENYEAEKFSYIWTGGKKDFLSFLFNNVKIILPLFFKNFFPIGNGLTVLPQIFLNHFRWSSVLQNVKSEYFISYHDHGISHILRNHYLMKSHIKSIHYKHTHAENVFSTSDNGYRPLYSYMNYDMEIHWSNISVIQSKSSNSGSKNYFISGPLWLKKSKRQWKNDNLNVIFYPTSHGNPGSINDDEDHLSFLETALSLVEDNSIKSVFFKPKHHFKSYFISDNKNLRKLSKKLNENEKFIILDFNNEVSSYIDEIDISIHLPFSSSFLSTLFSGIRSFYFDPNNKYPNAIYNKLDGMVYSEKKGFRKAMIHNKKMTKEDFDNKFLEISKEFFLIDNFHFNSKKVFHEALNKLD